MLTKNQKKIQQLKAEIGALEHEDALARQLHIDAVIGPFLKSMTVAEMREVRAYVDACISELTQSDAIDDE